MVLRTVENERSARIRERRTVWEREQLLVGSAGHGYAHATVSRQQVLRTFLHNQYLRSSRHMKQCAVACMNALPATVS
eukprot:1112781-Karenia_brevis.AAC.1